MKHEKLKLNLFKFVVDDDADDMKRGEGLREREHKNDISVLFY
jgi:hypothetical protein